ncbi:hypothetical protein DPMN_034450 [Dreissena polymorpha]|uniref:Uncharacterized protein n=1 Tax=Dreissena polymorpha TaxID=45954 RepID=A0A9D4M7P7_DREPO|nr:hypothetical protein DPMN_034450 [Dreissena polymorpha]
MTGITRNPSIASGRSDSRRSHGSIDSTDFELSMGDEWSHDDPPSTLRVEPAIDDDTGGHSSSYGSNSLSAFNDDDIQSATFALQRAQFSISESRRTQGDGGNVTDNSQADRMSTEELKKAVVSMMLRKDEVEEQNKALQQMLEQEMEASSILRAEIETMRHQAVARTEKDTAKYQALQKENELLKHQLRKYVNAVQMLRLKDPLLTITWVYSHEAEEYEKKLIQVAEMHGELMEFNELLHRQLNLRENMLKRLQNELINLRGPKYCHFSVTKFKRKIKETEEKV